MKKNYLMLILAILSITQVYSANITAPSKTDYCLNTNTALGSNIVITETANGDFITGTNYLFITAPTGFEFVVGSGALAKTGTDITATPTFLFRTTSVFAISYVVGTTADNNSITLSGLQLRATALGAGTIQVGAGSTNISGISVGNSLGAVATAITAMTPANNVTKCSNDAQYAIAGYSYTGGGGVESFSSCGSCVSGTNFRPYNAPAGTNNLTYTVTKAGCTFSDVSTVTINAAPTVGISSSETSGNTANNNQICNNDNGTYTGYGADNYQFQVDGSNTSTSNPWITASLAVGTRSVRVIGTETSTGCKDTSNAISIVIHPLPGVPTFNPTTTGFDINAAGFKLDTLSPAVSPSLTANSYFTNGGGTLGIVAKNYFYPNIAGIGSHVITYHYVDGNGCENISVARTLSVSSVPTPGVITGLSSQYCSYDGAVTMSILQTDANAFGYSFEIFNEYTLTWVSQPTIQTGAAVPYTYSATFNPSVLSQTVNGGPGGKRIRCFYWYTLDFGFFSFTLPLWTPEKIVVINPPPTVSIVNTFNGWSCQNAAAELLVSSPAIGGTPVFTSTDGGAGFITNSAGNYYLNRSAPAVSASGSCYNVTLTFTDATTGCSASTAKTVCIDRTPIVPTVVTPAPFCQGDFVTNLQMNVTTNGTVKWYRYNNPTLLGSTYISSGGGGASFFSPGVLAVTDTFTATMTNIYNTCTSAQSAILKVTMNTPATVNAGAYANFCSTGSVTLAGTRTPGALGITWSKETGANGTFGAPGINAPNPTYTPGAFEIGNGKVKLYLTTADPDGANGCPFVKDSVTIGIDLKPQLTPAVTSPNICGSSDSIQAYLSSANAAVSSVTWSESAAGTIALPTSFTPFYKFNASEINTIADIPVTLTATSNANGACSPQVNTVNFTIKPQALVSVPATTTFCESQVISFTATVGGSATFVSWGTTNGLGTINSPGSLTTTYTPHVSEQAGASNIKFYAITNNPTGPCNSVADTIALTINKRARVSAGADVSYCAGQTYRLDGTLLGSTSSITWSGRPIANFSNVNAEDPIYTPLGTEDNGGAYNAATATKAPTQITFTITGNDPDGAGPCLAESDNVVLSINPKLTVNAGTDILVCAGQTINLNANVKLGDVDRTISSGAVNTWSVFSGAGTVTPVAPDNFTGVYNATGNMLTNTGELGNGGSITLLLTSADPDGVGPTGPCTASSDFVNIKINQRARVTAGSDTTFCANDVMKLNGDTLTGATTVVTWSGRPASSFSNINIHNPVYTPISLTEINGGAYNNTTAKKAANQITFTITGNDPDGAGPCPAESDDVVVSINPKLTVDAGTDITVCAGQTINLNANVKLGDVDRTITAGPVNTWSVFSGAGTVAPIGPDNFTGVYNASGNMLTNTGELGNGGFITLLLSSADPDGTGATGPCTASSDFVNIRINQRARVTAGADTTYCANDVMELNGKILTPSTTLVTWTGRPVNSFSNINLQNPVYTPISLTEINGVTYTNATGAKTPYQITFTITGNDPDGAGPCPAESDDVIVSINPKLTVYAGSDLAFCGHTLMTTSLKTLVSDANIKLGNSDRITSNALANSWSVFSGAGTNSGVNFNSNFNVNYQPSGLLADSGNVVSSGSGEFGNLSTITLMLRSEDPDAGGPCKADSDFVNIKIYPRPIPHFSGFEDEYCRNSADVTMFGNLSSTVSGKAVFSGIPATPSISTSGDFYKFKPSDASISNTGANLTIRYKHTDANNCYNYVDTVARIFPIPQVSFTPSSRCQYDTVTFTETATITSIFPSTEIDWDWVIDGDTLDNSVTPNVSSKNRPSTKYAFSNYGNHTISLVVTTDNGVGSTLDCTNRKDTTLIFGPYPKTQYSWSRPCSVDSVSFINKTTIPTGYSNVISWTMGGAGVYTRNVTPSITTSDSLNPVYKYNTPGLYNVRLRATTNTYGCIKDTITQIYVVPTISVTPSVPYATSFASGNQNWAPSGQNYSWAHGTPTGKQVINPGKNVWITNLTGNYNLDEYSTLNSPCFNFGTLDKPMMTLNLWSNTRNLAGAVLEATVGNNKPWVTIGQIGDGKNWYNTQGIVGLIGASATNPIAQGFSGELTQFDLSRIGLSQYANEDTLVRFRITFGSSDVNDALNKRDGIAFDSIWIGNRSKVVLIEHFTNSLSAPCIEANDTLNSFQTQRGGDMVSIHYHTSFPGTDNMNLKNPADPSSRVLYYGITAAPRTQVDGVDQYNEYGNTPAAIKLNSIDNKALENAKFTLDLSSKKVGLNLNVKAQLVAKEALSQDVVLNIAVLEKYVSGANVGGNQSGYQWVLKKMLPDAAGTYISKSWAIGDTVKTAENWDFTISDFYDTSQVEVVAFVQNFTSKEVYQAARVGSSGNTGVPIITTVDVQDIAENLMVYPVPADNEINVLFGSDLLNDTEYSLNDDMGRVVEKGVVSRGVRMLSFNSKKLASGMYYLSLTKEDGSKLNKKIVVIH